MVNAEFKIIAPPGVNFTNMFMRSFCARRSRKRKKTDNMTVFFMLLDSRGVNAAHRTLMKLTPGYAAGLIIPLLTITDNEQQHKMTPSCSSCQKNVERSNLQYKCKICPANFCRQCFKSFIFKNTTSDKIGNFTF